MRGKRAFLNPSLGAALAAIASMSAAAALLCSCDSVAGKSESLKQEKEPAVPKELSEPKAKEEPAKPAEQPQAKAKKPEAEAKAIEFSDSFSLSEGRKAGQSISGAKLEKGDANWAADGAFEFRADGSISVSKADGGAFFHQFPRCAGLFKVSAELSSAGSSCAALSLFNENPAGKFFALQEVSLVVSGGSYEVAVRGVGKIKTGSKADNPGYKEGVPSILELEYDSLKGEVTAKINGVAVVDRYALKPGSGSPLLSYAGVRLNGPVKPGVPFVKSYSATVKPGASSGFSPLDYAQFFVEPGKDFALRFKAETAIPGKGARFACLDYQGKELLQGEAEVDASGIAVVKGKLPRGFYELSFPDSREAFGLVALEAATKKDPFFCMDSSLSWLETDPLRREGLIKILARCGITMSRERLGVGHVNRQKGKLAFDGGKRAFDDVRKSYLANGVPILEMLDGGARRDDLPDAAESLAGIASHWQKGWDGVEVCNEPDIRSIPADQYIPMVKMMSYALAQAKTQAPLVSGVFATMPPSPFFDSCAASGFFEDSDAVSFHSYDRATDVEAMVARYRVWMKKCGYERMPLWHSECGWHWTNGPARPPVGEDAMSALEIAAKGVESLACGVARHFPFVYVYYEEGFKNFGMMGREATPLRSMAAYAYSAYALGGRKYIGDLPGLGASVKLARVFQEPGSDDCVVFVYTGALKADASTPFPFKLGSVCGADGRELKAEAGKLPVPDGVAYAFVSRKEIASSLKADTSAAKLYALGQEPTKNVRKASPLIIEFIAKETPSRASSRLYLISESVAKELPLKIRVHNMSQEPVNIDPELKLPDGSSFKLPATDVPAMGRRDLAWKVDASKSLDIASTRLIVVSAKASCQAQPSDLAIPMAMEGSLERHLAKHSLKTPLPIEDLKNWETNIAGHGKSKFSAGANGWKMDVSFPAKADNWAYPKFKMPFEIDPAKYSGILIRAKIATQSSGVAILANPNQVDGFWASDLFPADGEWHVAYVPFAEFRPGPGHAGMQNTRLNAASWKILAVGMGTRGTENSLEISHFMLVGGSGSE